ncbi:alkaline phosphatase family protein [Rugosimonospora africana]|uniref:phospholipase C n=1 Tax=Rugosimonospora africana TaxID=556532 RepID=A0A8J3VQJ2_9ACTN|nr:alkaline phosphatase family protein [Rugosimonospora africana]GIH15102.1 putative non-hemolytic phospholipase C [Rugosimonospora africana]
MPEGMSDGVSRRRLLGAAGGAASLALLPGSVRKALGKRPEPLRSLRQIEHVIFLMQENRSFDHYFGTLPGVAGFDDPHALRLPNGRSVFYQPDTVHPDGYVLPFRLDTTTTSSAAVHTTTHAWGPQHLSWNGGRMDNWMPAHRAADGNVVGPLAMGYYTREDLPFHFALADAFTVCDRYFCSVFGPTHPNRVMAISGTIDPDGKAGGPVVDNSFATTAPLTWTTYPERLQQAGISWKYYTANPLDTDLGWFHQFRTAEAGSDLYVNGMTPHHPSDFADDVVNDRLPQVVWLDSQYLPSVYGLPEANEHAPALPAAGAEYIYNALEALASRPDIWSKSVFIVTYDENDGFFDHVPPPTAPEGTPGEWVTASPLPSGAAGIAGPIGLGYRVPTLVVSPWSSGGWVCSDVFDHTSMLRLLERRFRVAEPNISAWRRRTVGDLTSALRLGHHNPHFPSLPDPAPVYEREVQEVATLPSPTVPTVQTVPHQERGHRRHTP